MSITITPEQEKVIRVLLATGRFQSTDEVIQAALSLLEEENQSYQQWVIETRAKIDEAIEASKYTPPVDGETFVNGLLERFHQARETHAKKELMVKHSFISFWKN